MLTRQQRIDAARVILFCLFVLATLVVLCLCSQPAHAEGLCFDTADAALAAAEEGRKGTPLSQVLKDSDAVAAQYQSRVRVVIRKLVIDAYLRGTKGVTTALVWEYYYDTCVSELNQ